MPIALMPQRPPFVTFEQRAVEDRNASIAAGGLVMRDVDYVIVRQVGSKDTVEKLADEWLNDLDRLVQNGTYPAEWARHFREKYMAFKAGQSEPELGLSVRQWPSLSKAQAENCIAAGVRTVEDVANMNEPTMQRVGMGARELKAKAKTYIESRDANKAAEQITALRAELDNKNTRIETLEQRLSALEAQSGKRRA
jgi:polyhydroxyalkanoate synthesis regulator phasin